MKRGARPGQTTVEFAIVFSVFALVLFGAIEVSRAVYERHALARAAEVIAQELASSRNGTGAVSSATAGQALQDGARQSGLGFNTSNPPIAVIDGTYDPGSHTCAGPGTGGSGSNACDLLVNSTNDVFIIALPSVGNDNISPLKIVVTVTQQYHSFLEFPLQLLGGQASETVSATTLAGQDQ